MSYKKSLISLYALQALIKGQSVFYFVLLPVFYAEHRITTKSVGYIGALFIVALILGAVIVARWLHRLNTRQLISVSSLVSIAASALLFLSVSSGTLGLLVLSYGLMGLSVGTAMSGLNAVAANLTNKGNRYKILARIGMLTDVIRITFPLLVAALVLHGASTAAVGFILLTSVLLLVFAVALPKDLHGNSAESSIGWSILGNKSFKKVLSLEFFDSFSSSQLFVFLPLLFIAKGYSLSSSLVLQSCVFVGYLCGRWLVSVIAHRYSGIRAIAYSELGMVITILLLLVVQNLQLLYLLSFLLGAFARGTSPAIKALAFDVLDQKNIKKGSAMHVVAGDSGSALGQLLFGLMIAWWGVRAPFLVAASIALLIAVACLTRLPKPITGKSSVS